jgi:tetratricopeptide (TPR) repeat protein
MLSVNSRLNSLARVVAVSSLLLLPSAAVAQEKPATQPTKAPTPAASSATAEQKPKIELEPDEKAYQAASRVPDSNDRADALIKLVADYPEYPYIRNAVFSLFRDPTKSIRDSQQPQPRDPEKTRLLVDRFVKGTAGATAYARAEFYHGIARNLVNGDLLLDEAAALAAKAVPLLNEADYVANERRLWERKEHYSKLRDPNGHVDPFSMEESKAHFRAFSAAVQANLGTALLKSGKLEEAKSWFHRAYAVELIMEAATGLSDIAGRNNDTAGALQYMMDAMLTGKLPAAKIAHLEDLYARVHKGDTSGLAAELDQRFRARFTNPLHPVAYQAAPEHSRRVVLAEFITGAGCEPCTSVDLAFDAALKRYKRDELALIVYHMHAPTSDPMSNASAEERFKYYDVHGAPTVILDGGKVTPGEGMKSEAERVYGALDKEIAGRLTAPEAAQLAVTGQVENGVVNVDATAHGITATDHPLRLHLALVENEISYSGENGLRFHPMVVRNLAHPNSSEQAGFVVTAGKDVQIKYAFDLKKITADNLQYYDWYVNDLFKRVGIKPTFREKRNVVREDDLSVVAFIQDDTTKQILQAAYVRVSPGSSAETKQAQ